MKRILTAAYAVIVSGAIFQGCAPVSFSTAKPYQNPAPQTITPPCDCDIKCFKENYDQANGQITTKLDILFVTDTSGSLDAERASVATGIKNFVGQLSPNIDFNIGVMLGHGSASTYAGKLYKVATEPLVLKSKEMTIDNIMLNLNTKLTKVVGDSASDGGEEGLYSTTQALKAGFKEDIISAGLFRPDAALAIVYIADENDICARYPSGVTPVYDPDKKEIPAFTKDCANVTANSVYAQLKALKGDLPLIIGGVIYNGVHPVPVSGENEIGYGYTDIIKLNNGVSVDIAGNNITNELAEIGKKVNNQINFITEFKLKNTGVDSSKIEVYVNGVKVNHTYTASTNSVHIGLESAIPGSKIEIRYCLEDAAF